MSNAEIVEMTLATYIATRPAVTEISEIMPAMRRTGISSGKVERHLSLNPARELAQELGLLGRASTQEHAEEEQPSDSPRSGVQ